MNPTEAKLKREAPYMYNLLFRLFTNSGYTNDSDKNLWENSEVSNEILQQVGELLEDMKGVGS